MQNAEAGTELADKCLLVALPLRACVCSPALALGAPAQGGRRTEPITREAGMRGME